LHPSRSKPMVLWTCQLANFASLGRKISSAWGSEREGAFLFCREFWCWCSATTLSCYMTPCQPLTAWTDDLHPICIISLFKLPREHIYRGLKNNNNNQDAEDSVYSAEICG